MSDCKHCGTTFVYLHYPALSTQRTRYCSVCLEPEEWNLDEDQDPIGYKIDKDRLNLDKDRLKTNKQETE